MSSDYITNRYDEPLFNCQICGEPEPAFYVESTRDRLIHHELCFQCDFWIQRFYMHITNDQSMIVGGEAYMAHPFDTSGRTCFKGHGGRLFTFKRIADGSVVKSNDVWHQGVVPDQFRHILPDNALMGYGDVVLL